MRKRRCVRRAVAEKRYLNEKGQPSPLFQPELLTAGGEEPVFLLEGAFDALSAEELGYRAAALNGAGNREKAAALLRGLDRPAPILLLTDNDAAATRGQPPSPRNFRGCTAAQAFPPARI